MPVSVLLQWLLSTPHVFPVSCTFPSWGWRGGGWESGRETEGGRVVGVLHPSSYLKLLSYYFTSRTRSLSFAAEGVLCVGGSRGKGHSSSALLLIFFCLLFYCRQMRDEFFVLILFQANPPSTLPSSHPSPVSQSPHRTSFCFCEPFFPKSLHLFAFVASFLSSRAWCPVLRLWRSPAA